MKHFFVLSHIATTKEDNAIDTLTLLLCKYYSEKYAKHFYSAETLYR